MSTDMFVMSFVVLHLPALIVCGLFFVWGRTTKQSSLGPKLRTSAVVWLIVLWSAYSVITLGLIGCDGDLLYGYRNCTLIPTGMADASVLIYVLTTAAASIFGVILGLYGAAVEWRNRRR